MKEHMVYKRLGSIDLPYLKALIRVYEEVFEMENLSLPPESYLQSLLQREGLMFFVATLDGHLVGGLTAHVLPSVYFESAEVYIYDLGVKTSYQRKGIGRKLLATIKRVLQRARLQGDFCTGGSGRPACFGFLSGYRWAG